MTRLEPQPPALISALVSARATFLRRGDIDGCVDEHVGRAWVRSGAHHVDPHRIPRQRPDSPSLLRARANGRDLVQAAEPALRLADDILGLEPHMVILTDADGVCLRLLAPAEQLQLDPAGNMFEGASWNERDVGSNGLGSAVATRDPFVIAGPQHFADDYLNWTCMGVPLRGPGGAFVGVFNLSVRNDRMSPHTWGWTLSLAQNIEAALRSMPPSAPEELEAMDDPLRTLIEVFDRFTSEVEGPANQAFVEQTRRDLARAEAQARRRIRSLHESQARLEELDERKDVALASLAHELKTPLAVIFMLLDLAEHRGGGAAAETSAKVRRQATRLSRMIADVGDVARVKQGALAIEVEPVDLNQVVRAVAEATRPEADRHGHRFGVELSDAAPVVNGDAGRLEQIVTNLVVNAIKYTPRGGSICVASDVDGSDAVLRVSDTGLGIAPENLERIFESFTRVVPVSGDPGGMGLGLSLVASLVRLHGGTIRARSDGPGRGSEFEVRLPLPDRSPLPELST
jgi:signal transduction histidine kinase